MLKQLAIVYIALIYLIRHVRRIKKYCANAGISSLINILAKQKRNNFVNNNTRII